MNHIIPKPVEGTYPTYYNNYYKTLDERPALEQMQHDAEEFQRKISGFPKDKLLYAYAPGKWTIKQVLQHVIDTERILTCRSLCFARGEQQVMPGFDENAYADKAQVNDKPIEMIALEMFAVRQSSIALYFGLTPEELVASGKANHAEMTVNAIAWMVIGHARHHFNIIAERYL